MTEKMKIVSWPRQRANFFTGLAVILPFVASVAVVLWLFGTISHVTNLLLIFFPPEWVTQNDGTIHRVWSLVALLLALLLITVLGALTRYYVGKKALGVFEAALLRIPVFNKIYGAVKQLNDAFSPSNRSAFHKVVLVKFPSPESLTLGFLTSEHPMEISEALSGSVGVFVPTTPNPTSGFLIFVKEKDVVPLEMSVADGLKTLISLGAITSHRSHES